MGAVLDVRGGRDERQPVLALEPLPRDLHVQQAEEPAAEAEAQGTRRLGLVRERGVVEPELLERLAQLGVLVAVDGVETAEHHRLGLPVPRQRLTPGRGVGHRLTDPGLADVLDPRDQVADLARSESGDRAHPGAADTDLLGVVGPAGLEVEEPAARVQVAVEDPDRAHDAPVRVVDGVEDQRLERRVGVAGRRRHLRDQGVEELRDPLAGLGRDAQHVGGGNPEDPLDLLGAPVGLGRGQVDLVERGDDGEVGVERGVAVGQGLGLDPLGRVDEQERPLARGQAARHLVAEVHVAGGVDELEDVVLPLEPHVLGLDRDAPLALEVHGVEVLGPHVTGIDRAAQLEDPVGQGRLAVVDVGDDREGAVLLDPGHTPILAGPGRAAVTRRSRARRRPRGRSTGPGSGRGPC